MGNFKIKCFKCESCSTTGSVIRKPLRTSLSKKGEALICGPSDSPLMVTTLFLKLKSYLMSKRAAQKATTLSTRQVRQQKCRVS